MKYSEVIVARICELVSQGRHTIADICKMVDISEAIFYKWREEKIEFFESLKKAERKKLESIQEMAASGLAKLLNTHEYEEVHTEYENDGDKPKIVKQKRVKKIVMPNPTAVIFALTNRDPQTWKNRQDIESININTNINSVPLTKEEMREIHNALNDEY